MMNSFTTARTHKSACAKTENLEERLTCIADAGPQAIADRLTDLDHEWTAGRITKAVIGVALVAGFRAGRPRQSLVADSAGDWGSLPAPVPLRPYVMARKALPRDGLPARLRGRSGEDGG